MELRLLSEDDMAQAQAMSNHAFGMPTSPPQAPGTTTAAPSPTPTASPPTGSPPAASPPTASPPTGSPPTASPPSGAADGLWRWGLFNGETLAAKANDRFFDSMIGGLPVPTAGVAGVVVLPEYRGLGLASRVMTHLLKAARDRGAVISTLFRTAPALYRSLGYEQVADLVYGRLPMSALRGLRVPEGISLRRATPADSPGIRAVYDTVAAQGSCLLTRRGPQFQKSDDELIQAFDGVTLAVDTNGRTVGYAGWDRGSGWGAEAALTVKDLLATTSVGTQALLAALASFESVVAEIRLRTTGTDPVQWQIPGAGWSTTEIQPYMLRVVDLAGAVAARGWSPGLAGRLTISIDDPVCPWNTGLHLLEFDSGHATVTPSPTTTADVSITPTGLALLYAGGVPAVTLRRAGLISGGTAPADTVLDEMAAGPRPGILDFF